MAAKKGLVIEKGEGWAIIMLPDGEYQRIKTNQYLQVGELFQETNLLSLKYVAAAVVLLALLLGSVDYYSVKAYAQVSSLAELGVNRWGRVISVKAKNDEGQRILATIKVKNETLEAAVKKINSQAMKDKQSRKTLPASLSIEITKADQTRLEEKLLEKSNHGLQDARQAQKHLDDLKGIIKNNEQPKEGKNAPKEKLELPSPNAEQGHAKEMLKEEIKNLDEQVESLDPLMKKHAEQIEIDKELNLNKIQNDFENDIANEKDELIPDIIHDNKDKVNHRL